MLPIEVSRISALRTGQICSVRILFVKMHKNAKNILYKILENGRPIVYNKQKTGSLPEGGCVRCV